MGCNNMKKHKITIENKIVAVDLSKGDEDYISLTDIAKFKDPESTGIVIAHWLSTKYTIQFIGAWEQLHNPFFNVTEFDNIKKLKQLGLLTRVLTYVSAPKGVIL
jgi:hypothetical protein